MTFTVDRNGKNYLSLVSDYLFILCLLSPFLLIRDFGKQIKHPRIPSVLRVIDRSDRNPPITAC